MTDWLSEIEEGYMLRGPENWKITLVGVGRMARVLRELGEVVKCIALDDGDSIVYAPNKIILAMRDLSDDAKELLG